MPFARLFGALATERFSGVLRLEQEARNFSVSWAGGEIIDAESSAPDDTIGRVALEAGLIDNAAVGESIRRMARDAKLSQRDALLEIGAIKAADASRVGRLALTRRALRIFALPAASYTVDTAAGASDGGGPLEPRWILYRGLRQSYDERRLDKELLDLADKAIKLPGDDNVLQPFGFSDEERIVAAYLQKGYWEASDLVDACMTLPRGAVLSVVLSLYAAGALDIQLATSVPRLRKRVREATMRLSRETLPPSTQRPPTKPPISKPPATNPPAPAPAAARPTTVPPSLPSVAPGAGVLKTIKDQIANKLAQVESGANHFLILEVDRGATSAQIKSAYFSLAKTYHPDRLALVRLEPLRPQVEKIFSRLSDAFSAIGEDARRKEYLGVLAQGGEAAVKQRNDDEAERATKMLTAEEHFRKGEMALRRDLFTLAEQEFKTALELNPEEPEHHALLAWSRFCGAADKETIFPEVRKLLNKALELSQKCLPAYLHFGQIYMARGEPDKAAQMFQRVLDLNPDHVESQRQLRFIDMRRAKGGERKGLFDMFKKKS